MCHALHILDREQDTVCFWRQLGLLKVQVRHQSSRVSLMHTEDSLLESSGSTSTDSILTKQIAIWLESANSNTHLPGCAEKQKRNTMTSKHPETQQSLTLYLSRRPFPHSRNPELFSALMDKTKKNTPYNIQTFSFQALLSFFHVEESFTHLLFLLPIHIFDWCELQTTNVTFWCRPMPGTMSSRPQWLQCRNKLLAGSAQLSLQVCVSV